MSDAVSLQRRLLARWKWLRWLRPPGPTINTGRLLDRVLDAYPPSRFAVLDLGCGPRRIPGTVRCDIALEGHGVRADAARLPFPSHSFDAVLATALLEHVPYPHIVVREIRRVLRPGGVAYIEIPFLEGFHADPDDYQRLTFRGLEVMLRRFELTDREVCVGPSSALTWILREYPAAALGGTWAPLVVKYMAAWLTAPLRYLDYFMARRPGAYRIAGGLAVIARRPSDGAPAPQKRLPRP